MFEFVVTSTICMSAVSQLAVTGPLNAVQLRATLSLQGFDYTVGDLDEAITEGVERRLLRRLRAGKIESCLPQGHVVRERDRNDPSGWTGWIASAPDGSRSRVVPFLPEVG